MMTCHLIRASRRLLCFTTSLRVFSRNRRATLYRRWNLVPWRCSKKAANRGCAPDAANVFNGTSIKANSAFMLAPLIPQTPFNKGGVERPSNIMSGIMRNYLSVTSASPRTLS